MINIYLSPSTQEKNIGNGSFGTEEYQMNLLTDILQEKLSIYQDKIKTFRNKPEWDLRQVINDSNKLTLDLHLALHSNAHNRNSRGCEVFCNKFNTKGHYFANMFYTRLSEITPTADRGVKEGFNFYGSGNHMAELFKTKADAVLIEIAFHDNKDDAIWIVNNLELIAQNLVDTILCIFNIKNIEIAEYKEEISKLETALLNQIRQNESLQQENKRLERIIRKNRKYTTVIKDYYQKLLKKRG